MIRRMICFVLAVLTLLIVASCDDDTGTDPGIALDDVTVIDARASECYGFSATKITETYHSEMLTWAYDPESATCTLHHSALMLNCCGAHTVDASYDSGVVTISENDQPDPELGRCWCECPFDFLVTLEGIPVEVTGVRIMLTVDDSTTEHWSGAFDPAEGTGVMFIEEPHNTL